MSNDYSVNNKSILKYTPPPQNTSTQSGQGVQQPQNTQNPQAAGNVPPTQGTQPVTVTNSPYQTYQLRNPNIQAPGVSSLCVC